MLTACLQRFALTLVSFLQPGRCSLPADLHPLVNSGIIHLAEAMYVEAVELLAAAQLQLPADPLVWLLQVEAQLKLQDAVAARALLSEMRSRLNRPHCALPPLVSAAACSPTAVVCGVPNRVLLTSSSSLLQRNAPKAKKTKKKQQRWDRTCFLTVLSHGALILARWLAR